MNIISKENYSLVSAGRSSSTQDSSMADCSKYAKEVAQDALMRNSIAVDAIVGIAVAAITRNAVATIATIFLNEMITIFTKHVYLDTIVQQNKERKKMHRS